MELHGTKLLPADMTKTTSDIHAMVSIDLTDTASYSTITTHLTDTAPNRTVTADLTKTAPDKCDTTELQTSQKLLDFTKQRPLLHSLAWLARSLA